MASPLRAQNNNCTPVVTCTVSQNNICSGTEVTFFATIANSGTNGMYKWKRNNQDAGAHSNPDYTAADLHEGDTITCEYSCTTACGTNTTVTSKPIIMHVLNDIKPIITIANNDTLICEGELTVFTTQAFYGNGIPSYQWMVNGKPVGTSSPSYATDSLTNGSHVVCVLTVSVPSCPGTLSSTSQMTIYVYPMVHPAITITPSKTDICRGEQVTFTATANGGAYPSFAWEVNGQPTGDVNSSFTSSTLKDGDSVSCTVTIDQDSRCHTTTSAPSNKVVMHVKDYTDPTLLIEAPLLDVCKGTALTFTAIPQNAGNFKLYQWQVNDHAAGNDSPTFTYNQFENGDKVSCTLSTLIPGCSSTINIPSNDKLVTVRDTPVITFLPPEITIMSGESAQLKAVVSSSTTSITWDPGAALLAPRSLTTTTVPLTQDTIFKLTVADTYGCIASKYLPVKVLRQLHMPNAFTPNYDGNNDLFRIPPGASLSLQEFSIFDRWGNIVFRTKDRGKGWDGMSNGQPLPAGTYIYLIRGWIESKHVLIKGTVTLLR
jgi:gliding motility-associated-like protein